MVCYYEGVKKICTYEVISCTDSDNDGYSKEGGECGIVDCDDSDSSINPDSSEICDGIDNDCDGQVDEGCDDDGDDYCDAEMEVVGTPGVCSNGGGDCDDTDPDINPSAAESCDGIDNDCDGQVDEDFDLQTDPENCGSCGNVCGADETCEAGECVPAEQECTDFSDCPSGEVCKGGLCVRGIMDWSDDDFAICHTETCAPSCVVPEDDTILNNDTVLCRGYYEVADQANNGTIIFNSSGIELDCNGAELRGDWTGTGILAPKDNVNITGCNISGYSTGINLSSSSSIVEKSTLNNTMDLLIQGSSNEFSLNHFYGGGVQDSGSGNVFCRDSKGSFYHESLGFESIGGSGESEDCGLSIITQPSYRSLFSPGEVIDISWSSQSTKYSEPVSYWLGYSYEGGEWSTLYTGDGTSYTWDTAESIDTGEYDVKVIPNDGYANGTMNSTLILISNYGIVEGEVSCNGDSVEGATVTVAGYPDTTVTTESGGSYTIDNAPFGTHTITASKEGRTTRQKSYTIESGGNDQAEVNFEDVCPVSLDCESDCTLKGGDVCMAECSGFEGCSLEPLCDGVKKGLLLDTDDSLMLRCCQGEIVEKSEEISDVQLNETVDAENIIRTTRIVYHEGKPVKMVVVTWE